jgi:hypothetical protein
MKNKHCEWCDNTFETKVSYQIYCAVECREAATKQKIAERYLITRVQKRAGKNRKCKSCQSLLSIYNEDVICNTCSATTDEVSKVLKDMKGIANGKISLDE